MTTKRNKQTVPGKAKPGVLAAQLDAYAAEVRRLRPKVAASIDRLIARLQAVEAGRSAPKPGEKLPPFLLPDERGHLISLGDLLGKGPLVVMLRRGHWCPYCRLATKAIVGIAAEARLHGAGFVAITPDRRPYTSAFQKETGADFPVLTDTDNGYALSIGLTMHLGDELIADLKGVGFDLSPSQGSDTWTLPIPATFVLDPNGVIVDRHADPDYRRRIEAEDVLAAIRKAAHAAP